MSPPTVPWDYPAIFRQLAREGLLEPVLGLVREHTQEVERDLRGELLEGDLFEVDNRTRATLYRLQGRAAFGAALLSIMKTLARPPTAPPGT